MKVVYIAHPIGGDVDLNLKKLFEIIKEINLNHPDVVPFAPYIADVLSMDDNNKEERARGFVNNKEHFIRRNFDELWYYGISAGVQTEIRWCQELKIPYVSKM